MKDNMKKNLLAVSAGAATVGATALPVLASEATPLSSVESALTTSFTSVGSSITSVISTVLPIALPIIGAGILVFVGIKVFKKLTNKVG